MLRMALLFKHREKDLEKLKQDVAVIKHILSEEGKLNAHAQQALEEARKTHDSQYIPHHELKKRILR